MTESMSFKEEFEKVKEEFEKERLNESKRTPVGAGAFETNESESNMEN